MTYPFNSRTGFTTWGLWILALIVADQVIKAAVEASMPLGASIAITAGFNWVHAINPGAAFSFLADAGGWQRIFFTGAGLTVSAMLAGWLAAFPLLAYFPYPLQRRLPEGIWVAMAVWLVVMAGLVRRLVRALMQSRTPA